MPPRYSKSYHDGVPAVINPICLTHVPEVHDNVVPDAFSTGLDASFFNKNNMDLSFVFDAPIFKYFKACLNSRLLIDKQETMQMFLLEEAATTPLQESRLLAMKYVEELLSEAEDRLAFLEDELVGASCSPPYFMNNERDDVCLATDILLFDTEALSFFLQEEDYNLLVKHKPGRTLLAILTHIYKSLVYTHFIEEHEHEILASINLKLESVWAEHGYAGRPPCLKTLDDLAQYVHKAHDISCQPDLAAEHINHALHDHYANSLEIVLQDYGEVFETLTKFRGLHSFFKKRTQFHKFAVKLNHFSRHWDKALVDGDSSISHLVERFVEEVRSLSPQDEATLSRCSVFTCVAKNPQIILRLYAAFTKVAESAEYMTEQGRDDALLTFYILNCGGLPLVLGEYDEFILHVLNTYSYESGERVEVIFDTCSPDFSLSKLTKFVHDLFGLSYFTF